MTNLTKPQIEAIIDEKLKPLQILITSLGENLIEIVPKEQKLNPIHPGLEIQSLIEDYGLVHTKFVDLTGISNETLNKLIKCEIDLSSIDKKALAKAFEGLDEEFFCKIQDAWEKYLRHIERNKEQKPDDTDKLISFDKSKIEKEIVDRTFKRLAEKYPIADRTFKRLTLKYPNVVKNKTFEEVMEYLYIIAEDFKTIWDEEVDKRKQEFIEEYKESKND